MNERLFARTREAIELLAVTAAPGVQRVAHLALAERLFGLAEAGRLANDLAIAGLFGFFTAVGWAGLVMARVPGLGAQARQAALRPIALASLACVALSLPLLALLHAMGLVVRPWETALLLAGWSGYQLLRHCGVAVTAYRRLLIIEAVLLAALAAVMLIWRDSGSSAAYLALAVPTLVVSCVGLARLFLQPRAHGAVRAASDGLVRKGVELALVNASSGAMLLLLVPFTLQAGGPQYAGLVGLLISGLSVLLLAPRALSLRSLPALAVAVRRCARDDVAGLLNSLRSKVLAVTLGATALAALGWAVASGVASSAELGLRGAEFVFVLLLANFFAGQLALPESNYLLATEQSSVQLAVNGAMLLAFLCGALAVSAWVASPGLAVALLLGVMLLVTSCRALTLAAYVRRQMARQGAW